MWAWAEGVGTSTNLNGHEMDIAYQILVHDDIVMGNSNDNFDSCNRISSNVNNDLEINVSDEV